MAYFKCDTAKITTEQLVAVNAVQTLFHEQSMACIVSSVEPLSFDMKTNITPTMKERLFANRVPVALLGWTGKVEGNILVVEKTEACKPVKKRGRKPKSDTDLLAS